jgi:hypothetical protein
MGEGSGKKEHHIVRGSQVLSAHPSDTGIGMVMYVYIRGGP